MDKSPLPILIPLGLKESPQNPVFSITLSLHSSLNVIDHVSQSYSTIRNIIVLYNITFKFLERSQEHKSVPTE